jgi:hypothetical protein
VSRWWWLGAWVSGTVLDDLLRALGLRWLAWLIVGLLFAFTVIGQLVIWYRQGWRLRWPPGSGR